MGLPTIFDPQPNGRWSSSAWLRFILGIGFPVDGSYADNLALCHGWLLITIVACLETLDCTGRGLQDYVFGLFAIFGESLWRGHFNPDALGRNKLHEFRAGAIRAVFGNAKDSAPGGRETHKDERLGWKWPGEKKNTKGETNNKGQVGRACLLGASHTSVF